jgi:cytochrome P450
VSSGGDLAELVRIEDPGFYADDPFPVLARMRAEAPVFWYEPLQTWVLSRYEDVRYAGRTPGIFSNADGILLNDIRYNAISKRFYDEKAEFLGTSDPPRHRELRRYIGPSFTPQAIRDLEADMRRFSRELIDTIVPGEPILFVERIASVLPVKVIAVLFGVPADDFVQLRYWSDEMLKMGAALDEGGLLAAAANAKTMYAYFNEWLVRHLGSQGSGLLPALLRANQAGEQLSYENLHMFLSMSLTAGNETTRDFITGSIYTYARYPEQRAKLVADPSLIEGAVEECLRWVTPVRGFIRTLLQDTEIRGQKVERGQHVQLLWMSANRDEDVWENADVFDVTRKPNPMHLAFGFGEHGWVGAAVARLEGRVFFEELLRRYPRWELAGEPTRPHSVLHNSFEELPVVFYG